MEMAVPKGVLGPPVPCSYFLKGFWGVPARGVPKMTQKWPFLVIFGTFWGSAKVTQNGSFLTPKDAYGPTRS